MKKTYRIKTKILLVKIHEFFASIFYLFEWSILFILFFVKKKTHFYCFFFITACRFVLIE